MCWLRKGCQFESVATPPAVVSMVCVVGVLCMAGMVGCSTLPSSGIDPSGESVFLGAPPRNPLSCLNGSSNSTTYTTPDGSKTFQSPSSSGSCLGGSDNYPEARREWDNVGIVITPGRTVAPVGSQVIIVAGVVAPDKHLSLNERVEWSLTSGSVGQFVDTDPGSWADMLVGDFTMPRKISPTQAVTSTSRGGLTLNRGTPTKCDDIKIRDGQTWVAVSSPVEGSSFVNVLAPSVYGWQNRERTATIHWVDVEWQFPAPAFASAGGRQTLVTKISRHSDHQPLAGWRVRYRINGGPDASFSPSLPGAGDARVAEVVTNSNGEASVEITENQAVAGTSPICIEVFRPDGNGAMGTTGVQNSSIIVGQGSTMVTWSASNLSVVKTGPTSVEVGSTVTYRIDVTNPGDLPADDVQVVDQIPLGAEYVGSSPLPSQQTSTSLRWEVGRLNPREMRTIEVQLRATQPGSLSSSAEATAIGGLSARSSATTQVGSPSQVGIPSIELTVECKNTDARVGDLVTFDIYIHNRGTTPVVGQFIHDYYDPGLVFERDPSANMDRHIKKTITEAYLIQPGAVNQVPVQFRTTKPGRLFNKVTITSDELGKQILAQAQGYVDVVPAVSATPGSLPTDTTTSMPIPTTPVTTPATTPDMGSGPRLPSRPGVSIHMKGPEQATIGEKVPFTIVVENLGNVELTNLSIVDTYDTQFRLQPPIQPPPDHFFAEPDRSRFSWKLASLAPGKSQTYTLECVVQGPVGRAYNQVRVTTDQNVEDTSRPMVLINHPASVDGSGTSGLGSQSSTNSQRRGNLFVQILDFEEGVRVGSPYNYRISIKNEGATPDQNVAVAVEVSPELTPNRVGTQSMPSLDNSTATAKIDGQRVEFSAIPTIMPGETLSYSVKVTPKHSGQARANVVVSSRNVARIDVAEGTVISP